MANSTTSRCRSCDAPIIWIKTVHGKNHPLDAEPTPDGQWVITPAHMASGTEDMMVRAIPQHGDDIPRYSGHFSTCPESKNWSRKRGKA